MDWFAERMKQKLRKPENEAKGGWREDSPVDLLDRLLEEARELDAAIHLTQDAGLHEKFLYAVIDEAADVANFAAMIADVLRQRLLRRGGRDEV